MTENVTVVRDNEKLQRDATRSSRELKDRWSRVGVLDTAHSGQPARSSFVKQLWNMLELARVITLGALRRDESRGAHYKPDFLPSATTSDSAEDHRVDAAWQRAREVAPKTT